MKVEKLPAKFPPIIIKLETLEDVENILHLVSVESNMTLESHIRTHDKIHDNGYKIKRTRLIIRDALEKLRL